MLCSSSSSSVKVPIDLIKELRLKSKAGVQDCRIALVKNNLDIEKSIEWLHSHAKGVVAKKSSRVASEGLLAAVSNPTNQKLAIVELLCETDFAWRSPSFGDVLVELAHKALEEECVNEQELLNADGVKDQIERLVYTLKENVTLRRVEFVQADVLGMYMHQRLHRDIGVYAEPGSMKRMFLGPRLGIAEFSIQTLANMEMIQKDLQPFADKIATQILSMNPKFISKDFAPLGTYLEDILMEQEFILDTDKTVGQIFEEQQKTIHDQYNANMTLNQYKMFVCGEGIENKKDTFGDEVYKLLI